MREDEPFFSENTVTRDVVMTVLDALVEHVVANGIGSVDDSALDALFNRIYDDYHRRSATPEGIFSVIDRADVLDCIKALVSGSRRDSLRDVLTMLDGCEYLGSMALGEGRADLNLEPCRLDLGGGRTVCLTGNLQRVWVNRQERTVHIMYLTGDRGDHFDFPLHNKLLTPFIGYLALLTALATDENAPIESDGLKAVIHWTNLKGTQTVGYGPTPQTAEEYLQRLCRDLLDRPFDMVPYAIAARLAKSNTEIPIPLRPGSYAEATDKGNYRRRFDREINEQIDNAWSNWYPSPLLKLLDYSVPKDVWDLVNQRLALFHACSR